MCKVTVNKQMAGNRPNGEKKTKAIKAWLENTPQRKQGKRGVGVGGGDRQTDSVCLSMTCKMRFCSMVRIVILDHTVLVAVPKLTYPSSRPKDRRLGQAPIA